MNQLRTAFRGSLAVIGQLFLSVAWGQTPVIFRGEIHTGTGTVLKNATLTIAGENIASIAESPVTSTQPNRVVIIPGLIDANSSIDAGLGFSFERKNAISPNLRAEDGLQSLDKFFAGPAIVGTGLTIAYVPPQLWREINGQGVPLLLTGETVLDMKLQGIPFLHMSVSEAPLFPFGRGAKMPQTHMGAFSAIREELLAAREYLEKKKRGQQARYDPDLETVADVLEGKRIARIDCDTARDITRVVALADEFGIRPILEHATEAYKIRDLLAQRKWPLILMPFTQGDVYDLQQESQILSTPAWLSAHGVPVAFQTFGHGFPPFGNLHEYTEPRNLFIDAVLQVRSGMDREAVLEALTRVPAEILGLSDRTGTLAPGKWADFVILDGPPFEYTTHIQEVWIKGRKVFDHAQNDVFAPKPDQ